MRSNVRWAPTGPAKGGSGVQFRRFEPTIFQFLEELADNNNRPWFHQNKWRYDCEVLEPCLAFIRAFEPRLKKVSRFFVASDRRVGGSLMRVYRDTRFSKEKTPYKTNVGIQFRHEFGRDIHAPGFYVHIAPGECFLRSEEHTSQLQPHLHLHSFPTRRSSDLPYKTNVGIQFRHEFGRDIHAPGFYVHIAPGECFLAVGVWRPDRESLSQIRQAIVNESDRWRRARNDRRFCEHFELVGDSLKRPPREFPADHPFVEDLRRTDFCLGS